MDVGNGVNFRPEILRSEYKYPKAYGKKGSLWMFCQTTKVPGPGKLQRKYLPSVESQTTHPMEATIVQVSSFLISIAARRAAT